MKEENQGNEINEILEKDRKTEYGLRSIKGINNKESTTNLMKFGVISAVRAITILFYIGIIPILMKAIAYGRVVYLSNMYEKEITYFRDGQQWFTSKMVNNLPLGIVTGIVYFIFGVLIWKIVCELLIMIFRCFETYVEKNKSDKEI